ncbi:MAG: methyltransferase [Pseudomonadota bacterium]
MARLAAWLEQTSMLWRPAPFHHVVQPWATTHPALHAAIAGLDPAEVDRLHADEQALRAWLAPFIPGISELVQWMACERFNPSTASRRSSKVACHAPNRDVPGRKWAQIEAFAHLALAESDNANEVLDWCAGKSHLGRLIGLHSGLRVRALERDPALCAEAERLAARDRVALAAEACDVLSIGDNDRHRKVLTPGTLACALHACGDLHLALLDQVAGQAPSGLLVAPCCYHRTTHEYYLPRSSMGRACGLKLSREDLRLAVLETCTAGHAQRESDKRRKTRLLALRYWGGQNGLIVADYAPLKDIGRHDDVTAMIRSCERLGWPAPDAGELEAAISTGRTRAAEVRAFELIRAAMRRPLESWLVLDMALGLEESGFAVEVGEFCDKTLTPRNLMIRAWRKAKPVRP